MGRNTDGSHSVLTSTNEEESEKPASTTDHQTEVLISHVDSICCVVYRFHVFTIVWMDHGIPKL